MKKMLAMLLVLGFAVAGLGCSGDTKTTTKSTSASPTSTTKETTKEK